MTLSDPECPIQLKVYNYASIIFWSNSYTELNAAYINRED